MSHIQRYFPDMMLEHPDLKELLTDILNELPIGKMFNRICTCPSCTVITNKLDCIWNAKDLDRLFRVISAKLQTESAQRVFGSRASISFIHYDEMTWILKQL